MGGGGVEKLRGVYVYVNFKDMYITLKGIEKILFVSVLKILLICKSLNFTVVFTKKN